MNKNVLFGVLAASTLAAFSLVKTVSANEGVVMLKGAGTGGACFVASVFYDGAYKILATCRDLKVALTPEKTKYVLWSVNEKNETKRVGMIENGKLSGSISEKFVQMQLTLETTSSPNKPSTDLMLVGNLMPIDFGAGVTPEKEIITPTPTKAKVVVPTTTEKDTDGSVSKPSSLGAAVGTIFKIVLFGFGILLVVVGVFSFLSRRRSL